MKKDPSLKKIEHSLKHLEVQLLMAGIMLTKSDASNEQCIRMDVVINEALLQAQNIMLKALKIIKTPELLALVPMHKTDN